MSKKTEPTTPQIKEVTEICFDNDIYLKKKTTLPKLNKLVSKMIKMDGYEDILQFCIFMAGDKKGEIYVPDLESNDILVKGRSVLVAGKEGEYISPIVKDLRWVDIVFIANHALITGIPESQFLVNVCFLEKINGINVFSLVWATDDEFEDIMDLETK